METSVETLDQSQYLTFYIAGEEYGVGILQAKEILQYTTITKVPRMPSYICGVINLRGSVVPVIDLSEKFGLGPSEISRWTCIVITEVEFGGERTIMGMLVDRVSQVMDLGPDEVETPPAFGTDIRVDYLIGMGKIGSRFVLLLDVDRVLSESDILDVTSLREKISSSGSEVPSGDEAAV